MRAQQSLEKSLLHMQKQSKSSDIPAKLGRGNQAALGRTMSDVTSSLGSSFESPSYSAFDAASGHTLTPMSTEGASASLSAPVQAKKKKNEAAPAETAAPAATAAPVAAAAPAEAPRPLTPEEQAAQFAKFKEWMNTVKSVMNIF